MSVTPLHSSAHEPPEPASLLFGGWLTTEELAKLLNVDTSTLRRWRTNRPHPQGPPFVPFSERVTMYSARDVESWIRTQRVDPGEAA
jgi:hypothetical protein